MCACGTQHATKERCLQTKQDALREYCHVDEVAGAGNYDVLAYLFAHLCNPEVRERWLNLPGDEFADWAVTEYDSDCPTVQVRFPQPEETSVHTEGAR